MPDHEISFAALREMCALARDKLKTQTSRTVGLDTNILGVMALDLALTLLMSATVLELAGRL